MSLKFQLSCQVSFCWRVDKCSNAQAPDTPRCGTGAVLVLPMLPMLPTLLNINILERRLELVTSVQ